MRLFVMVKLFQLKASNGWSDCSFKNLLTLLKDMLPQGNTVPEIVYEAQQIICPLGLEVKKLMRARIIAFYIMGLSTKTLRKDSADDKNCNKNRTKSGPKKVFWYFPIIPHWKRWFANKELELL
jgi:hypothetical protein